MKILCYVNHFFGKNPHFLGKSSLALGTAANDLEKRAKVRRDHVNEALEQLKRLGDEVDVKICGINGFSLLPLDIVFDAIKDRPLWLIYESLNHMAQFAEDYDYFINIEDDILLPSETFANIVEFDKTSLVNEVLLPNRLEKYSTGEMYCVDMLAIPGWTQQTSSFRGSALRVALNPHSAILVLSRTKFKYALSRIDKSFRGAILYNELDSAFAYFHSAFALYRTEDITINHVIHLDRWRSSPGESGGTNKWKSRFSQVGVLDFFPPIVVRAFLFLKKKLRPQIGK